MGNAYGIYRTVTGGVIHWIERSQEHDRNELPYLICWEKDEPYTFQRVGQKRSATQAQAERFAKKWGCELPK